MHTSPATTDERGMVVGIRYHDGSLDGLTSALKASWMQDDLERFFTAAQKAPGVDDPTNAVLHITSSYGADLFAICRELGVSDPGWTLGPTQSPP